jgi:hypothetical protein
MLVKSVNEAKNEVAKHLKVELVERFKRLNNAMSDLAALDPDEAEGEKGAAVFGKPAPQSMVQQNILPEDPLTLARMPAELRRQISESARSVGHAEVSRELRNYIDSELLKPAFEHAKSEWASSGLKIAQDGAATAIKSIAKAKAVAPTVSELDLLRGSVDALRSEARRLDFAPPPNPDWWGTAGGKETSISQMTSGLAEQVSVFFTNQVALRERTTEISDLIIKNQQTLTVLNEELGDLNKRAEDLQSQLGEIGAPLKVISFKLSEIAPLMPLIVAITLAALAAWTAQGLKHMTLAARLVGDKADGAAIRTWLNAAAGGSRSQVIAVELAVTIASLAWVVIAARNVAPLPPPFLTQPILAAIAVVVVVTARAHHWRCANDAMSASGVAPPRSSAKEIRQ